MEQWEQRLVRRYNPLDRVEIAWRGKNQTPHDPDTTPNPVNAMLLDMSVTGMLVNLPSTQDAEPGDTVDLSWRGYQAVARVAHSAPDEQHADRRLVGVEIIEMSEEFETDLYDAVALLRGDHGQLEEQWHRQW